MNAKHTVGIIGLGPAGIGAALQLARGGVDCAALEKGRIGGLLRAANLIENMPGFKAITGERACRLLEKQLRAQPARVINSDVKEIEFYKGAFALVTNNETILSKYLIYAAGTQPIMPDLYREAESDITPLLNKSGMRIAVIGGGDAAFDYALNLAKRNKVSILMRGKISRALPLLQGRAISDPNITVMPEVIMENIERRGDLFIIDGRDYDSALVAVGRKANLELISNLNPVDLQDNMFIVGDAANGIFRQASIAFADGIRAAMAILNKEMNARRNI
ncbi:MAG: NAD(P)/FAD-dependent oxidoreductase [Chloroflexota bacterium]